MGLCPLLSGQADSCGFGLEQGYGCLVIGGGEGLIAASKNDYYVHLTSLLHRGVTVHCF